MDSAADTPCGSGLPHSEILGSKPARGSPRLFAACHVLHRLLAPRHPPDALAFLDPHQRQPHPLRPQVHRTREEKAAAGLPEGNSSDNYHYKAWPLPAARRRPGTKHTHANDALCPQTEEEGQRRIDLPVPATHDARRNRLPPCPTDGHLVTTSRCPKNNPRPAARRAGGAGRGSLRAAGPSPGHDGRIPGKRAWWAWADLNGRPHAYQACALTS